MARNVVKCLFAIFEISKLPFAASRLNPEAPMPPPGKAICAASSSRNGVSGVIELSRAIAAGSNAFTESPPSIAAAERRLLGPAVRGRKEVGPDPEYSADQGQPPAASVSEKCFPTDPNRRQSPLTSLSVVGFSLLVSSPFNSPELG